MEQEVDAEWGIPHPSSGRVSGVRSRDQNELEIVWFLAQESL